MIHTFRVRRPSLIGTKVRERGELVPEAHLWRLTDGMVRGGRLIEDDVSEADFEAAVSRFCPDVAAAIYETLGLEPVVTSVARRGRPKAATRTVVTTPPTLLDAGA